MLNSPLRSLHYSLAALLMMAGSCFAASTEWQDLGGGQARLVAKTNLDTNKLQAVLEVKLKPGWSTYWRYPGSSGIPPNFNFDGSSGIQNPEVLFPAPTKLGPPKNPYAGYKKSVSFPITTELDDSASATLKLDLLIGVCEEICIPAQAKFSLSQGELMQSDPLTERIVTFADLKVPTRKKPEEVNFKTKLTSSRQMEISFKTPAGTKPYNLFVEGPAEWQLLPGTFLRQDRERSIYLLDLSGLPEGVDPMKTRLLYTVSNGSTGFEIEH